MFSQFADRPKTLPTFSSCYLKMFTLRTSLGKIYRTNALSFCSGTFATYCARPPRRTALCRNTSANLQTTSGFSAQKLFTQFKDVGLLFFCDLLPYKGPVTVKVAPQHPGGHFFGEDSIFFFSDRRSFYCKHLRKTF